MSIDFGKLFDPSALGTSASDIYTVPSGKVLRKAIIRVSNITGAADPVTLYAIPAGGSASDSNAIVKALSVPANNYEDIAIPVLEAGDKIQGLAASASTLIVHAMEGVLVS